MTDFLESRNNPFTFSMFEGKATAPIGVRPSQTFDFSNDMGYGSKSPFDLKAFGKILGAANMAVSAGMKPTQGNMELYSQSTIDKISRQQQTQQKVGQVRGALESAAFASGNPYAMAGAAISKMGSMVDKASKNEDGTYKSGAWRVADSYLDPIGNLTDIFTTKTSFKDKALQIGKTFMPGLGLIKTDFEKQMEKERKIGANIKTKNTIADVNMVGSQIGNSLPKYQAPMYGRKGLKLRTKFSM